MSQDLVNIDQIFWGGGHPRIIRNHISIVPRQADANLKILWIFIAVHTDFT